MLNVTVNNRFGLHQRIMLMIMLVLLQFYSIGSDFFPEDIITTSMEMVDQEAPDVLLDFDDNASLRTVRQEQRANSSLGDRFDMGLVYDSGFT